MTLIKCTGTDWCSPLIVSLKIVKKWWKMLPQSSTTHYTLLETQNSSSISLHLLFVHGFLLWYRETLPFHGPWWREEELMCEEEKLASNESNVSSLCHKKSCHSKKNSVNTLKWYVMRHFCKGMVDDKKRRKSHRKDVRISFESMDYICPKNIFVLFWFFSFSFDHTMASTPRFGDALSFLDAVKAEYGNDSDVYSRFLDIMKFFKSNAWVLKSLFLIPPI